MKYIWMDEYLLAKKGVTRDFKAEWNWERYMIGGKMFAAVCMDENGKPSLITLKLEPAEGEFWRGQYEDVIPGYYMNKVHWNSIKADGDVPDKILQEMLDRSYRLVWKGLPKKEQKRLGLEEEARDDI